MNNWIEKARSEYQEVQTQLTSPRVVSDPKKLAELGRRQTELSEIITVADELKKTEKQIKENRELIESETDPELIRIAEDDITSLEAKKDALKKTLEALQRGKTEKITHIIVEIRAGAGGDEAALFAANLFRMYTNYAAARNWKTAVLDSNKTSIGGYKEIIFEIEGDGNVYADLKHESGVHRVQRIPETEKSGRIHTSTATVAVLPIKKKTDISMKPSDIKVEFFRSSGPGGQNVNKVETAVRILHIPTGLVVACQSQRSQQHNKEKALEILQSKLQHMEEEQEAKKRGDMRKSQVGTGERAEKIRTYNYPQDRITDHRIKKSWHNIENILEGNMTMMIAEIKKEMEK